jgi:uncharacterized protein YycO
MATAATVARRATRFQHYPPGAEVKDARPGDFLLTHSATWTGRLIRFGQGLRFTGVDAKYAHWNHAALFVNETGDVIEALGGGVQLRNVSVYRQTEYHVVYMQDVFAEDRLEETAFAYHCLNDKYGYLTDLSLGVSLLTGLKFAFGVDGQMICSGLVARSLERTGEIFEVDTWRAMPADLAKHFHVELKAPVERGQIPDANEQVKARSH